MEYVKSARMPKWVWNPFEGDVTLPYMYVCVSVLTFEEKKEEIAFFFSWIVSKVLGREEYFDLIVLLDRFEMCDREMI